MSTGLRTSVELMRAAASSPRAQKQRLHHEFLPPFAEYAKGGAPSRLFPGYTLSPEDGPPAADINTNGVAVTVGAGAGARVGGGFAAGPTVVIPLCDY